MTYLRKDNIGSPRSWYLAICIFLVCIGLRMFFASFISRAVTDLGMPLYRFENMIGLGQQQGSLQNEVSSLQMENLALIGQVQSLSNPEIATLVKNPSLTFAKVIAHPPQTPFDTLLLDLGTSSAVAGDTVYAGEHIVIGELTTVSGSSGQAVLYSSGGFVEQATVLRTGTTITLTGQGGGNFLITVPKDFDIKVGDMIGDTTSSQSIIAQVFSVSSSSENASTKVLARLPINILATQWVGIAEAISH